MTVSVNAIILSATYYIIGYFYYVIGHLLQSIIAVWLAFTVKSRRRVCLVKKGSEWNTTPGITVRKLDS